MGIGNAIIGALRVNLGLDSAAFTTGLKIAQGDVSKFNRLAKLSFAGLATAAAGVAVALAFATKASINNSDAMSKNAQKAGVSTEALSRLAYAASFSDVSLQDLTGSLGKLSKSMAAATQDTKGAAASAFAALGVSVTDSSGKLRDAGDVFNDISDRFSHLEDGATKTALSMALFGKSGAELVPFLNGGSEEIRRLSAQADQLGITLSTKTGKAAEKFNDTLGVLGWVLSGVFNKVAEKALPALQNLVEFLASPKFAEAAATLAANVINAMTAIGDAITGVINLLGDLGNKLNTALAFATSGSSTRTSDQLHEDLAWFQKKIDNGASGNDLSIDTKKIAEIQAELDRRAKGPDNSGLTTPTSFDFRGLLDKPAPSNNGTGGGGDTNLDLFTKGLKAAQTAIDPFEARVSELSDSLTATVDPFSQMKLDLTDLQTMFDKGRISAGQFGDAVVKTAAGGIGAIADLAGGLTSALSDMFKENKAIAVANAIVNGIGSVAKTFETYGATPWGFAAAGIAGLTAAANVASILSTNENSSAMPSSGAASAAAAPAVQQQGITFNIHGSGVVGVDDIVNSIVQQAKDGGYSDLVQVMRTA